MPIRCLEQVIDIVVVVIIVMTLVLSSLVEVYLVLPLHQYFVYWLIVGNRRLFMPELFNDDLLSSYRPIVTLLNLDFRWLLDPHPFVQPL